MSVIPKIKIHVVRVVVHGVVPSGIEGSKIHAESIFVALSEDALSKFGSVDGSHHYQLIYIKATFKSVPYSVFKYVVSTTLILL